MRSYAGLWLVLMLLGFAASAPASEPVRSGKIADGLIIDGRDHETYIFRVRRGGSWLSTDEWSRFLEEHTEETVRRYADEGIEIFHTHGYKGFGLDAEREEIMMLKPLGEIVHSLGMIMDTYCQVMTLVPETFFAEEPSARDWVQRDELGRPIMLDYGYQQSFRYKPNLAHPDYRKYYKKKIVRTLIEDCVSDWLHLDNFDCNREPESDHSPQAVEAFREYLKNKYSKQQQVERFGHSNIDLITPPVWNRNNDPEKIGVINDPVQQEWVDFRCWLMADWLRDIAAYARSLNPDIVIDINPQGYIGTNRAFNSAIWHPWIMKYADVTWSEENNHADYDARGVLISRIRTYKSGRTLGNYMLANNRSERMLAESLAFNRTLGRLRLFSRDEPYYLMQKKYLDFYRANRDKYTVAVGKADVAVLRTYATMAYDTDRAWLEQCMFEQALIQSQVPFDIIFDEQLENLGDYRAVVLAGQNNLSAEAVEALEKYVAGGGGLVATGLTGCFDHWGRKRARPGLAAVLGIDGKWVPQGGRALANRVMVSGNGRVVYMPRIVAPDPQEAAEWNGSAWEDHGSWILPANWQELAWAVRTAAGGSFSVETALPDWVALEQTVKGAEIYVHLVNYRQDSPVSDIPVDIELEEGREVESVRVFSPDIEGESRLEYTVENGRCIFSVPRLNVYDIIAVKLNGS